jgi:hypothetical protein
MATFREMKLEHWEDVVNAFLGAVLFLMPWLFELGSTAAAWNVGIVGAVIVALSIAAIIRFTQWEEWINLILGLWVMVSPWVLGFAAMAAAMWGHVVIGAAIVVLAALELWMSDYHHTPHVKA